MASEAMDVDGSSPVGRQAHADPVARERELDEQ